MSVPLTEMIVLFGSQVAVPFDPSCRVGEPDANGVVKQTCKVDDFPSTVSEMWVYKGVVLKNEFRSSDLDVCLAVHTGWTVNLGVGPALIGKGSWTVASTLPLKWQFDGLVCSYSSDFNTPEGRALLDQIAAGE
jgi:hypothetical protein